MPHLHRTVDQPRSARPTRAVGVTAALLGAALLLAGCGAAAEKVAEKTAEQAIEQQTGAEVDLDTAGDGSFRVETEDGTFSAGTGEIPADWPDDVPLPDDLTATAATDTETAEGRQITVTANTTQAPADLKAELAAALTGWTVSGETTATGGGSTTVAAQWDLDGRRVSFVAASMPDGSTSLTIGHTATP